MRNRPQREEEEGEEGSWSGVRCLSRGGGVVVSLSFTQKPEAAEKETTNRPSVCLSVSLFGQTDAGMKEGKICRGGSSAGGAVGGETRRTTVDGKVKAFLN